MTDHELTDRQQHVLRFIEQQISHLGYPPTIREIGRHLGIRSTNGVNDHLKALLRKGYLTKHGQKSRTLRIVKAATHGGDDVSEPALDATLFSQNDSTDTLRIPYFADWTFLKPFFSPKDTSEVLVASKSMLGPHAHQSLFATRYWGDDELEDDLKEQDTLIFYVNTAPETGQRILVFHDDKVMLRRYFSEGETIRLQPMDTRQDAVFIKKAEFHPTRILGCLAALVRVF